jgi:hypothetical protein
MASFAQANRRRSPHTDREIAHRPSRMEEQVCAGFSYAMLCKERMAYETSMGRRAAEVGPW